jgi:hypothetical protein
MGGREISVNTQERKTLSLEVCGMILKYWL